MTELVKSPSTHNDTSSSLVQENYNPKEEQVGNGKDI